MSLPEVDEAAFMEFKRYLYCGCATIESDTVIELLRLSDMHAEEPLKKECGRYLKEKIDKENLGSMLQTAHDYGEQSLFGHCVSFLSRHMSLDDLISDGGVGGASMSLGLVTLSEDCILEVLRSDYLEMPEMSIFNWARGWCAPPQAPDNDSPLCQSRQGEYSANSNESAEEAQRRLTKALEHIRFPLIDAKDLLTLVKPLGIVPSDVLLEAIGHQLVETTAPPTEGEQIPVIFRPRRALCGSFLGGPDDGTGRDNPGSDGGPGGGGVDGRVRPVAVAMRGERGPDWKWGDQDGGIDAKGVITAVGPAEGGPSEGWVRIRWDNGHVNVYRWGADGGKYDLQAAVGAP